MAANPLGLRLKQIRNDAGLSQLALAGKLGMTPGWVEGVESGRKAPSNMHISAWLTVCNSRETLPAMHRLLEHVDAPGSSIVSL